MTSRRFLSFSSREALFRIPSDSLSLERFYVLAEEDLILIRSRRRPENRLGLAIHLALLRYPGQGWREGDHLPEAVVHWLCEQLQIPPSMLAIYGGREATQTAHRVLATHHPGLRSFTRADFKGALDLAARAAFDTDDARVIMNSLLDDIRREHFILPSIGTLERIGLAGRARARRLAAQALNDALSEGQKTELASLIKNDHAIGRSRLTWLRSMPHSTSTASLHGLLERLKFVRALGLPADPGQDIHPVRLTKFAREGAVAPAHLLSDFGERRRIATLAAQMAEMNVVLTDASIAVFERLTGQLFTRSKRKQDKSWQVSQSQVGRLMRLFSGTLEAISKAHETGEDPYEMLEEAVGWERLLNSRAEIEDIANMATEDPLLLASKRYVQLRRFAPAFREAFAFKERNPGGLAPESR